MSAPRVEREFVGFRLPVTHLRRVDKLCEATGFNRSAMINVIILRGLSGAETTFIDNPEH